MAKANIVILGGGSGGVVAASHLGHTLGRDHNVTLIDQRPYHTFQSSYLWMVRGWRQPRDITRDLTAVGKRHVRFLNDRIVAIDPDRKRVTTATGAVDYDQLIISLGLQTHPEEIPGDAHLAHHPWEMDAALRLRDALSQFRGGRIVVGVSGPPYRCPPGPYEATWLIEDGLVERGLRERTTIDFFTPEPGPLGESGHPAEMIRTLLTKRGIGLHADFAMERVDGDARAVRAKDGRALPFDLLIIVPPHRPAQVLVDSGLTEPAGITVDYDTLATKWDGVYAIGDNANMPASKAGVVAHEEAEVVAHNIAVAVTGQGERMRLRLHTI